MTLQTLQARLTELDPGVSPNGSFLPGLDVLRGMAGAFQTFAVIVAVICLVIGGVMFAVGKAAAHGSARERGQMMMVGALIAAIIAVAAPSLIGFFSALGDRI